MQLERTPDRNRSPGEMLLAADGFALGSLLRLEILPKLPTLLNTPTFRLRPRPTSLDKTLNTPWLPTPPQTRLHG